MKTWPFLSAVVALALGCSSSSSGSGAGSNPFVGTWSCTNQVTDTFTQPAALGTRAMTTTSTVTLVDAGNGDITASGSNEGGAPCMLTFSVQNDTATLASGQSCTINGIMATFTMGTYTVGGNTLTGGFQANVMGTVTAGSKSENVAGTENSSSKCTKS